MSVNSFNIIVTNSPDKFYGWCLGMTIRGAVLYAASK